MYIAQNFLNSTIVGQLLRRKDKTKTNTFKINKKQTYPSYFPLIALKQLIMHPPFYHINK